MNTNSENFTAKTLGKVLAGAFLYTEKNSPETIQRFMKLAKKWTEEDDLSKVFDPTYSKLLLHSLIEKAVLGKQTDATLASVKEMDTYLRVGLEFTFLTMTGQNPNLPEKNTGRWIEPLWNLKKMCQKYLELSPSNVSAEELAEALKEIFTPAMETLREYALKL